MKPGFRALTLSPSVSRLVDDGVSVNSVRDNGATVDFKTATDRLLEAGITLGELADKIGVSRDLVTRARMDPTSEHHRSPPDGWREAARRLAEKRGGELCELADDLEGKG